MALSRVLCPDLVGRESELSQLEDALLSTLRGEGGVVIVGGEAGTGKTRLVNALAISARSLGCIVVSGACSEAELSLPYLPFLEAIGNHLQTQDLAQLRERLGAAADELAQLFPQMGRAAVGGGDSIQAKLRLFESILLLLRDAARARALVLILEDLHWADPATRELLDYATRRLRSSNVLVLATYRSDELHRKHALLPTIQGWRRSGQVELIELKPLDSKAVGEMVCTIFDESSISDEFRDFLRDRSEGNPFVLEEMLRDALDRGDIFRTDKGWDRKTLVEMRIPRTVKDTILQRLERLSRQDVAILSAASVFGRSFDITRLAVVAGVSEADVLTTLETSITAQLLEEEDLTSGRYRFRHALTREAIYEDMVVPRRQQLHARVADALQSAPGVAPVDLAHHLFGAGRNEEAVTMCVAAAEDALRAYAYRDAAELFERAAPYLQDRPERARMLCRAADAYWNNSETPAAKRLLEQGVADLESCGLTLEAAEQRLLLGRCYWELMRSDLARKEFEQARNELEGRGPSDGLAIAYIRLAGLSSWSEGDFTSALDLARRANEIATAAGASLAKAWSWNFIAGAEIALGRVETGFSHYEDSYEASLAGGYRFQVTNATYNACWEALHLGLGRKVTQWFDRLATAWVSDGEPWLHYLTALVYVERGRVGDAVTAARTALQRARDAGHQKMIWRCAVLLGHVLAENLRPDEAAAVLPPISTRVDAQDTVYDTAARVRTHLAAADPVGARETAGSVRPGDCHIASPVDVISETSIEASQLKHFIDALPIRGEVFASPRLAAARGRLALKENRLDDALRELGSASASFEDGGLLLDVWHVGRSLAEAEVRTGDSDGARRRLASIVSAAEPAGARLAAKLARDTAIELGFDIGPAPDDVPEAPSATRVVTGERMVSVLFADVRGYTARAGHESPAAMAGRIASLQRWATQEVTRRYGIVDKFAGDAIMATFNVSGQSIDHALQALKAAIAIIDKAALAGLPIGAGLAVGPAVVGNLAESANLSVLGDVTNLASRLQAQSGAGEVTMTEEAFRRTRDWVETQHMAAERLELDLKGFGKPVTVFRLATSVPAVAPTRALAGDGKGS